MMKMKLNCNEANHVCDKSQYKEASFLEKVKLTIHLIYCRACRKYTANNTKLTKAVENSKVTFLEEEAKNNIKNTFNKALEEAQ